MVIKAVGASWFHADVDSTVQLISEATVNKDDNSAAHKIRALIQ